MRGTWKFILLVACLSVSVGVGHAAVPEPQETPASAEVQSLHSPPFPLPRGLQENLVKRCERNILIGIFLPGLSRETVQ